MSDIIKKYNEYIEDNLYKRYPLTDYADDGGSIPDSFMADIKICIGIMDRPGDDSYRYSLYISKVTVYPDYAYVEFSDSKENVTIAKTNPIPMNLSMADSVEARTIRIVPTTEIPINGTLIIGTCSDIKNRKGVHTLSPEEGRLFPSNIIIDMGGGVDSIRVNDVYFTGEITLEAGKYINIEPDQDTNTIRISVDTSKAPGLHMSSDELMDALASRYGTPIVSVNGVSPDSSGNINILPTDCFMVTKDDNNHSISFYNPCAPTCSSYDFVNESLRRIKELNDAIDLLRSYYESTANTLAQMGVRVSAVIESRKNTDAIEAG